MLPKKFAQSVFNENVFTLFTGTALGQVINFGCSIYLTRIYAPEDFGLVSIFLSIAAVFLVFSCGRYDVAMVASKSEKDADKLFSLSHVVLWTNTFLLLISAALIYFLQINIFNNSLLSNWVIYLPLVIYSTTQSYIFWMWKVREKSFKEIAAIRVIEAIMISGSAILLKSFSALGLLLANIISNISTALTLAYLIFKKRRWDEFLFNRKELKKIAKQYIEFPKVNVLQGFNEMFQVNAVPLIGAFFIPASAIGFFTLSMRVLQAPMWLIIKPIAIVFFAESSEQHRQYQNLYPLLKKTIIQAAIVATPVPLVAILAGPELFSFVFGEQWYEAGIYARIFSVWIFFDLIRQSVVQIVSVIGKQRQFLMLSLIGNLLLIISLIAGGLWLIEPRKIFILASFTQASYTYFLIYAIMQMTKKVTRINEGSQQ